MSGMRPVPIGWRIWRWAMGGVTTRPGGSSARRSVVVSHRRDTPGVGAEVQDLRWSPGGNWLTFTSTQPTPLHSDVFLADVRERREHQLTHSPAVDVSPVWSPDGRRVAWISGTPPTVGVPL